MQSAIWVLLGFRRKNTAHRFCIVMLQSLGPSLLELNQGRAVLRLVCRTLFQPSQMQESAATLTITRVSRLYPLTESSFRQHDTFVEFRGIDRAAPSLLQSRFLCGS